MPEIRVIEPIIFAPAEKLRVCAYARVSSDSTDQRNSFASQVNYYTKYIQAHEGWTFVDIYADQGITGTSALKRDEFLRLMRDCRQGKIDRILVKSVSRFARNAQDCIEAVRELRQLGVTVYFEKEHINTANMSNEMFLSMMSAFAQEESISISKNMRKGAVMRMKNGTFRLSQAPYGYYLDEKGILIVQQEESKIVQRIFGNQHQEKRFGGSKKGIRFSKKFFETHRKPHGYWVPVISVTKDKPVRFSYGFIFIYNLPLACLERQGVLSKISFQDISGSRQKSLCRPARLYVSLAPISLKSGKCQNIRFIIS